MNNPPMNDLDMIWVMVAAIGRAVAENCQRCDGLGYVDVAGKCPACGEIRELLDRYSGQLQEQP